MTAQPYGKTHAQHRERIIMTDTAWLGQAQLSVHSAQGLDVSNFQGQFDWAATSGLSFGIYRLTQGLSTPGTVSPDPDAQHNHDAIKAKGLHHGAYHFLDPHEDGAAQAHSFVATHHTVGLDDADMLWLDNENNSNPGPAATAACARAFMTELHKLAPRNPMGVYTFISYATGGYCAGLGQWPLWLAYPASAAPAPPPPWAHWLFWQWGSRDGTDADAFNGTAADLDAWLASFAPAPKPQGPYEHTTAGHLSLAALAAQHHETPAEIIRDTVARDDPAQNAALGNYLNTALDAYGARMPAGLRLWLRRTP